MRDDGHILLRDGRKLAYAEFGNPDGHPVLWFHGSPSSRLEPALVGDEALAGARLRVIAPDRPGVGRSDFKPCRGFSDWPDDVVALADALGLKTFSVLGNSGGGPYSAVCAAKIPERLSTAVVVSGAWNMVWPGALRGLPAPNRMVWTMARRTPFLLPAMLWMMQRALGRPRERLLASVRGSMPPSDVAVLERASAALDALVRITQEGMRQGTKGTAWDMRLCARTWDFALEEIQAPLVLFHGEEDRNVPVASARRAGAGITGASLTTYAGEGHLSTLCNHVEEIARALAPRGPP